MALPSVGKVLPKIKKSVEKVQMTQMQETRLKKYTIEINHIIC